MSASTSVTTTLRTALRYRSCATCLRLGSRAYSAAAVTTSDGPTPSTAPKPKKLSPYRLVPARTFLTAFAPLHMQGWTLGRLATHARSEEEKPAVTEGGELQNHELIRTYTFEMTKDGWKRAMRLVGQVGEVVEQQDHHPKILICPIGDLPSPSEAESETISADGGYAVRISTHTHTPLPPPPAQLVTPQPPTPPAGPGATSQVRTGQAKMRPGVTTKDLRLAQALEELYAKS